MNEDSKSPSESRLPARDWTLDLILQELNLLSETYGETAQRLVRWVEGSPAVVGAVGPSRKIGTFRVSKNDRQERAIFSLHSDGRIEILFDTLANRPPFDSPELREELRKKLNELPGPDIPQKAIESWGSIGLDSVAEHDAFDAFSSAVEWCLSRWND